MKILKGSSLDLFSAALAWMIWTSTYIITTQLMPDGYPMTAAVLRALPAGMLLLTRKLAHGV